MGIGVSILLIAAGAVLTWGVTAEVEGLDVSAIGVILMIVGLLGLVLSIIFWQSWGGVRRRSEYVEGGPVRAVRQAPARGPWWRKKTSLPGRPAPRFPSRGAAQAGRACRTRRSRRSSGSP